MASSSTFTYVLIPANDDEPMQEITMAVPPTLEENIGCLTKALNAHYSRVAPIQGEAGKQAVIESVKQQMAKNNPAANVPDESMLAALACSQTCDIVQLLPCIARSNFVGVNLYVDDKGQAKSSPQNMRASQVCGACGLPQAVLGDAFLAKMFDDQEGFERQDVRIADLASDAPWVREAAAINANRTDPSAAAAQLGVTPGKPPPPPPPAEPLAERLPLAVQAKAAGTELFKQGDVAGAATKYVEATDLLRGAGSGAASSGVVEMDVSDEGGGAPPPDPEREAAELLVTCLTNLAMCRMKQARPTCALEACDRAIAIDGNAGKAWFRRGQACMHLEQYPASQKNLHFAATLMPSSREVRDELARCQAKLAERKASGFLS
jgi:tetratricopeptide (TPR) repeat protein